MKITWKNVSLCLLGLLIIHLSACEKEETRSLSKEVIRPVKLRTVMMQAGTNLNNSFSGTAKGVKESVLSFRVPGVLQKLQLEVGNPAALESIAAVLDDRDYLLKVKDLNNQLKSAEANLSQLVKGARTEDLRILESKLKSAHVAENNAQSTVKSAESAIRSAESAIRGSEAQVRSAESNIGSAESAVQSAISARDTAKKDYDRVVQLYAKQAASKSSLDRARTTLDQQQNQLEQAKNQLEQAKNQLEQAKTQLEQSKNQLEQTKIQQQQAINQWEQANQNIETAQNELKKARAGGRAEEIEAQQARVQSIRANLIQAQANLADTQLKIPFAGIIAEKHVSNFEQISAGQPVYTLVDIEKIEVQISVPESMIGRVSASQEVRVNFLNFPEKNFAAQITKVGVSADPKTLTFPVFVQMENPEQQILPGMTANVLINIQQQISTYPTIPINAIVQDKVNQNKYVWVFDPDQSTVSKRTVVLGLLNQEEVEILQGLQHGNQIVVAGVHSLTDGMKVKKLVP